MAVPRPRAPVLGPSRGEGAREGGFVPRLLHCNQPLAQRRDLERRRGSRGGDRPPALPERGRGAVRGVRSSWRRAGRGAGGAGAARTRGAAAPERPARLPAPSPRAPWADEHPLELLEAVARAVPARDRLWFCLVCQRCGAARTRSRASGAQEAPAAGKGQTDARPKRGSKCGASSPPATAKSANAKGFRVLGF